MENNSNEYSKFPTLIDGKSPVYLTDLINKMCTAYKDRAEVNVKVEYWQNVYNTLFPVINVDANKLIIGTK